MDFFTQLPFIILAQAMGVGLAWGVDALSWKWRRNENAVFSLNLLNLIFVLPWAIYIIGGDVTAGMMRLLGLAMLWLLCLAIVQSRQLKITLRAAFCGALMQSSCFGWTLFISLFLIVLPYAYNLQSYSWFFSVYLLSAALIYALLSLFRPTIAGAWKSFRQKSGAKRRLR